MQTLHNIPVWERGVTVQVKQGPSRVVGATSNLEEDISAELPDETAVGKYRNLFETADARRQRRRAGRMTEAEANGDDETGPTVRGILGVADRDDKARVLGGKFYIYRYLP